MSMYNPTLVFVDLDDTLADTTLNLQGDPSRIARLRLVRGAPTFLRRFYGKLILLSSGEEAYQHRKIAMLGVRTYFDHICIVPHPEDKFDVLIGWLDASGVSSEEVLVVGDRVDHEILYGNRLGCVTSWMRRPFGRHSKREPERKEETPRYTVRDFTELCTFLSVGVECEGGTR